MNDWKHCVRIGLRGILGLGVFVMLLPGYGFGAMDGEDHTTDTEWLLTPEALARTAQGECVNDPFGDVCYQECRSNNGGAPIPLNSFECR